MTVSHAATPYGTLPPASELPTRKPISLPRLNDMRARGDKITSADRAKTEYPCPRCAVPSPRWDGRSCPKCGGRQLAFVGQILWD